MNAVLHRCLVGCVLLAVTSAHGEVPGGQFTSFAGFNLGTINLGQVSRELGAARLIEEGDGGEYTASICYRTPFGLIYFLSGEMGGLDHDLLGFGLSAKGSPKAKDCANWPTNRAVPDLSLGAISLGMSKTAFERAVGVAVRWENDIAYVAFEGRRPMTLVEIESQPNEVRQRLRRGELQNYYDVDISLIATFQGGSLIEVRSWKTETQ